VIEFGRRTLQHARLDKSSGDAEHHGENEENTLHHDSAHRRGARSESTESVSLAEHRKRLSGTRLGAQRHQARLLSEPRGTEHDVLRQGSRPPSVLCALLRSYPTTADQGTTRSERIEICVEGVKGHGANKKGTS